MSEEHMLSPFERALISALTRLAHGGIDGPTGFEALTMAISGEGSPGRYSVGEGLQELAVAIRDWDLPEMRIDMSIAEMRGSSGENYVIGLIQSLEAVARAHSEQASARNRVNVLELMDRLGLSFNADGRLSSSDLDRLDTAQRTIATVAQSVERGNV